MHANAPITASDIVRKALLSTPDRIAVSVGDTDWTGRHLAATSFKFARALGRLGLTKGDAITFLLRNCAEFVALHAAAVMIGLRQTFLNPLNPATTNGFIIRDAEVKVLVTDQDMADQSADAIREAGTPVKMAFIAGDGATSLAALAGGESSTPFSVKMDERDECALMYTSGSTGRPKGVLQSQGNAAHLAITTLANWEWPQEVRSLVCTPLTHAAYAMVLPTLLRGGSLHIQRAFDPDALLSAIQHKRITAMLGVPTMIYALLQHSRIGQFDLSSMRSFFYGSSPMAAAKLEYAIERFGPIFCQFYGQTEAPMNLTYLSRADHDITRSELLSSCGQAQIGTAVRILDEEGQEVPAGKEGEICARGPLVMQRYWKNPEATEEVFKHGWLHTGDVARQDDDGYLYIVDRKKDMIISGGINVYPREVEDVLAKHPAVAQAAVIGVPHERWGEAVHAVIVLRQECAATAAELIDFVRGIKGSVQAPKSLDLVAQLPLNSVGKVDKIALRKPHWAGLTRRVN
jgi:fatty-acyl-CoA synthase